MTTFNGQLGVTDDTGIEIHHVTEGVDRPTWEIAIGRFDPSGVRIYGPTEFLRRLHTAIGDALQGVET